MQKIQPTITRKQNLVAVCCLSFLFFLNLLRKDKSQSQPVSLMCVYVAEANQRPTHISSSLNGGEFTTPRRRRALDV